MSLSRRHFQLQYFYALNERGHLYHLFDPTAFIERGALPSGPAHLRDAKFLDFFFRNLHPTPPELPHARLFPFVSRCGREGNFLATPGVVAPVVFTAWTGEGGGGDHDEHPPQQHQHRQRDGSDATADSTSQAAGAARQYDLLFAGTMRQRLEVTRLREWRGRLYHPVDCIRGLQPGGALRRARAVAATSMTGATTQSPPPQVPLPPIVAAASVHAFATASAPDGVDSTCEAFAFKGASECCEPVAVEVALLRANEAATAAAADVAATASGRGRGRGGECDATDSVSDRDSEVCNTVASSAFTTLGLVSSAVAFDIGFNCMSDDSDHAAPALEGSGVTTGRPRYTISMDGGASSTSVRRMF